MIQIIGGKCDGQVSPTKTVTLEEPGETYILMSFKEGPVTHYFYMLAGTVPADALKIYRERTKNE